MPSCRTCDRGAKGSGFRTRACRRRRLRALKERWRKPQATIKQAATARLVEWVEGFVGFYDERRKAEGNADFDDLLIWARNLVRDDVGVRAYFQAKYRCILVDEFQDTDPLQAEMIIRLCAARGSGCGLAQAQSCGRAASLPLAIQSNRSTAFAARTSRCTTT